MALQIQVSVEVLKINRRYFKFNLFLKSLNDLSDHFVIYIYNNFKF